MPSRSGKGSRSTRRKTKTKHTKSTKHTKNTKRTKRTKRIRSKRSKFLGGQGAPPVEPLPYTTETTGESPRIAAYNQSLASNNNQNFRNNMFNGGKGTFHRRRRHIKGGNSDATTGKMTVPQFGQANPESNQASVLLNQSKVNAANSAMYDSAAYVK